MVRSSVGPIRRSHVRCSAQHLILNRTLFGASKFSCIYLMLVDPRINAMKFTSRNLIPMLPYTSQKKTTFSNTLYSRYRHSKQARILAVYSRSFKHFERLEPACVKGRFKVAAEQDRLTRISSEAEKTPTTAL